MTSLLDQIKLDVHIQLELTPCCAGELCMGAPSRRSTDSLEKKMSKVAEVEKLLSYRRVLKISTSLSDNSSYSTAVIHSSYYLTI